MKLDRISKSLLAAARYTERNALPSTNKVPTLHLLNCVSMSLGLPAGAGEQVRYHECAKRLFDAIGSDLADFTKDKAIDALVAAAYWNVPQREPKTSFIDSLFIDESVSLAEELRIEASLSSKQNEKLRSVQLYRLAAARITTLEETLRNILAEWPSTSTYSKVQIARHVLARKE